MSLDAMDWVWTHSKSKGVGRLVMVALADKALPATGECKAYGSYRFLAQRANCTQGAITEALDGLYALGELELTPDKGPMGAATYRLTKAVGHVRPVRGNRSAHPSDSGSKAQKESLGSAEQQVHGSAERSEAESHGSAEHITTTSPKTTTSAPTVPSASPAAEGGGGGQQQDEQQADHFLQSLPLPWTAGPIDARRLAPLLLERIAAQGWDLDDALVRELTKNPGKISSFPAVLPSRIANLLKRPTSKTRDSPAQSLPSWCKHRDCDEITRRRTTEDDEGHRSSSPCRACHPDHYEAQAA